MRRAQVPVSIGVEDTKTLKQADYDAAHGRKVGLS